MDKTPAWVLDAATIKTPEIPAADATHDANIHVNLARPCDSFRWTIAELDAEDNGVAIAQVLITGMAITVSDGSFKNQQGMSAFVGVNVIPGSIFSQSPCQSELGGAAGVVEALSCICKARGVTKSCVKVGLDGKEAVKEAFALWPLDLSRPDHNLLRSIHAVINHPP